MSEVKDITGQVLSPSQAARELQVSRECIHLFIRSGKLPATRTPLGYLLDSASVARLRAEREAAAAGVA